MDLYEVAQENLKTRGCLVPEPERPRLGIFGLGPARDVFQAADTEEAMKRLRRGKQDLHGNRTAQIAKDRWAYASEDRGIGRATSTRRDGPI